MKVEISPAQAQFLVKCIDLAVRKEGITIAGEALAVVGRIQHAAKADEDPESKPDDDDNDDD